MKARSMLALEREDTVFAASCPGLRQVTPARSLVGQLLGKRYRVLELIGRGGMATVYRAEHLLLGRMVAIKVLAAGLAADADLAARLLREARATAAVDSPHVVSILDVGRLRDGSLYLVLEYLEGTDLGALVAREGALSLERALPLALQLCDALEAVHAAGVVHRDITPHNVFLTSSARVKLFDFGICKVPQPLADGGGRGTTRTGYMLGTPHYMAPEQVDGATPADPRTDIYALGATLWFLLTGRPPFEAASFPRLLLQICEAPLRPLPHGRGIARVLSRALAKRMEDRFESAAQLREALVACARRHHRRVQ